MRKLIYSILLGLVIIFSNQSKVLAEVTVGAAAPDFSLTDTSGKSQTLSEYKGKFVVLEWFNFDCPFVRKHYDSGNMQGLQKTYTAKDVIWLSINSSAPGKEGNYSAEETGKLMAEKRGASTAVLIDGDGTLGKLYGAKTTPHMFIINPEGVLIYQGAIDDKPSADPADIPSSRNYVSSTLDAAMSGKPVEVPASKSYGCSVKY